MSFILIVILYIGKEVYAGIAIKDNVSNFTHILGDVIGGIAGYSLNRRR